MGRNRARAKCWRGWKTSTRTTSAKSCSGVRRLAEEAPLLGEPYTRQLDGKLRELRFFLGRQRFRITYYIASGRRIIRLTVFYKTKTRETAEVDRARRAMRDCIAAGHTAED